MSSTEDSSSNKDATADAPIAAHNRPRAQRRRDRAFRSSNAISDLFPNARSVAFVPFWDYERSRWFAGIVTFSHDHVCLLIL